MNATPCSDARSGARNLGWRALCFWAAWVCAPVLVVGAEIGPLPVAGEAPVSASAAKNKHAVLTVVVTGDHKPVVQADVKVLYGAAADGIRQFTNASGKASFASLRPGQVKVRVIAPGWKTAQPPVLLKEGENQADIILVPDTGASAPVPQ